MKLTYILPSCYAVNLLVSGFPVVFLPVPSTINILPRTIRLVKNQEGKQRWITEAQVNGALKAGYTVADKRMSHAAPEWIQNISII